MSSPNRKNIGFLRFFCLYGYPLLVTLFVALGTIGVFFALKTSQNIDKQLILEWRLEHLTYSLSIVALIAFCIIMLRQHAARARHKKQKSPPQQNSTVTGTQRFFGFMQPCLWPSCFALILLYPLLILLMGGASLVPQWVDNFGILILIYVILGWGLNIVVGLAGLLDLGYVAFYAIGSYAYALLSLHFGWSFWLCLPVAGILAAFWGIILGFPVLRLRGDYLAIVTLAFGEIIYLVAKNFKELTNGGAGLSAPRIDFFGIKFDASPQGFAAQLSQTLSSLTGQDIIIAHATWYRTVFLYYIILALAVLTGFVATRLRKIPVGRAWEALREDEIACRSLGINTTNTKLTAFAVGAFFGGLAGSFFGARQGFIDPEGFQFIESALILAIVVLGGMGSLIGVAIAAAVMQGGTEILRELGFLKSIFGADFKPEQYRMLIFGLSMVMIMLWKPRGFVSTRVPTAFLKIRKMVGSSHVKEGHG